MKLSRGFSLFVGLLLPVTLCWKLTLKLDNPDLMNGSIIDFLMNNNFSAVVTNEIVDNSHVIRANSKSCNLAVAKVSPIRNAKDEVQYITLGSDRVFTVFRGAIYGEQPRLWTASNYLVFRVLGALRLVSHIPPILAVISTCDQAERLPWHELQL